MAVNRRDAHPSPHSRKNRAFALAAAGFWSATAAFAHYPAFAQYPGHIETKTKAAANPRSVAVLEWTGEAGKPNASRLVPVTVFDGEHLNEGGIYLARPEPLALDSGTEYELERSGTPEGWFDVATAGQLGSDWFGFGTWKPIIPPAPKKLKPAQILPQVVKEHGDETPHFKQHGDNTANAGSTPPPAGDAKPGSTPNSGSKSSPPPPKPEAPNQEPPDPERPTLRRRPPADAKNTSAVKAKGDGASETATDAPDPDRPHLTRGKPAAELAEPKRLDSTPADLQQMIAVSDATDREPQSFVYTSADPAEAAQFQRQVEFVARQALVKAAGGSFNQRMQPDSMRQPVDPEAAAAAHSARNRRQGATVPPPVLKDVVFRSFALTYGGGATLVFTARTEGDATTSRYVTVIAQPDIYGALRVLFTSVTDGAHLDEAPRMHLVDAVDARGDRRGDLLFELRNAGERRFALYRVAAGQVDQIFVTDPLPTKIASSQGANP